MRMYGRSAVPSPRAQIWILIPEHVVSATLHKELRLALAARKPDIPPHGDCSEKDLAGGFFSEARTRRRVPGN